MEKRSDQIMPFPNLPDIDKQINFIKHLRQDVIPCIRSLQTGDDMIFAIEQSLIAAKILAKLEETERPRDLSALMKSGVKHILNSSMINSTGVRIDVLKAILSKGREEFTIAEIYKTISESRPISKSAVIATMVLFKQKGLIDEVRNEDKSTQGRTGRPEAKFVYLK